MSRHHCRMSSSAASWPCTYAQRGSCSSPSNWLATTSHRPEIARTGHITALADRTTTTVSRNHTSTATSTNGPSANWTSSNSPLHGCQAGQRRPAPPGPRPGLQPTQHDHPAMVIGLVNVGGPLDCNHYLVRKIGVVADLGRLVLAGLRVFAGCQ
jgi:hypothetical protein